MKKIISVIFIFTALISTNFVFAQSLDGPEQYDSRIIPTTDELFTPPNNDTSVVPPGSYSNISPGGTLEPEGVVTSTDIPVPADSNTPKSSLNYSGWVQCDGVVDKNEPDRNVPCNFTNLVNMANYLIRWAFMISIPIFVGLMAYSGFLFMTGKEANIKKSREMLWNAVIGFVIMLLAWFIVTTLINWLAAPWTIQTTETLIK